MRLLQDFGEAPTYCADEWRARSTHKRSPITVLSQGVIKGLLPTPKLRVTIPPDGYARYPFFLFPTKFSSPLLPSTHGWFCFTPCPGLYTSCGPVTATRICHHVTMTSHLIDGRTLLQLLYYYCKKRIRSLCMTMYKKGSATKKDILQQQQPVPLERRFSQVGRVCIPPTFTP